MDDQSQDSFNDAKELFLKAEESLRALGVRATKFQVEAEDLERVNNALRDLQSAFEELGRKQEALSGALGGATEELGRVRPGLARLEGMDRRLLDLEEQARTSVDVLSRLQERVEQIGGFLEKELGPTASATRDGVEALGVEVDKLGEALTEVHSDVGRCIKWWWR